MAVIELKFSVNDIVLIIFDDKIVKAKITSFNYEGPKRIQYHMDVEDSKGSGFTSESTKTSMWEYKIFKDSKELSEVIISGHKDFIEVIN